MCVYILINICMYVRPMSELPVQYPHFCFDLTHMTIDRDRRPRILALSLCLSFLRLKFIRKFGLSTLNTPPLVRSAAPFKLV